MNSISIEPGQSPFAIEQGNALLAHMDGKKRDPDSPWWRGFSMLTHNGNSFHQDTLKYHRSYDWLMGVVKAVEAIDVMVIDGVVRRCDIKVVLEKTTASVHVSFPYNNTIRGFDTYTRAELFPATVSYLPEGSANPKLTMLWWAMVHFTRRYENHKLVAGETYACVCCATPVHEWSVCDGCRHKIMDLHKIKIPAGAAVTAL